MSFIRNLRVPGSLVQKMASRRYYTVAQKAQHKYKPWVNQAISLEKE